MCNQIFEAWVFLYFAGFRDSDFAGWAGRFSMRGDQTDLQILYLRILQKAGKSGTRIYVYVDHDRRHSRVSRRHDDARGSISGAARGSKRRDERGLEVVARGESTTAFSALFRLAEPAQSQSQRRSFVLVVVLEDARLSLARSRG